MKKTLLVTRPCYDDATNYLFYNTNNIIKEAGERGISVIDLKRPRLTQENFTNIIRDKNPQFIFFNAHGNDKIIYGDKIGEKEEILVEEDQNHQLLDSRIIYARACWVAASLGKACRDGCFIGYKTPFGFFINEKWSTKPLNDNTAKIFLAPSNLIANSLINGSTTKEAVERALNMSKKNILKLLKEKEEPGAMASVLLLWNNMQGLELLGNENMKF